MAFRRMTDQRRDDVAKHIVEMYDREGDSYRLKKYEDTLIKAARILRDPRAWRRIKTDDVGPLTLTERIDLEREELEVRAEENSRPFWVRWFLGRDPKLKPREPIEAEAPKPRKDGFWHMPKELRTTIITLCFGAIVQGWVQTAGNGANLTWLVGTNLGDPLVPGCDPHGKTAWIFAIVNAAPWFSAAIFALFVTDPATELLFGRRAAIIMAAVFTLSASIGGAFVRTWQQLLACRILLGLGMGCKASVVPVFAAEVAPARMRGALIMNWQTYDAFGILAGYTANLIVSPLGKDSWRWMIAAPALPTIILLALALIACPESPRFLMSQGHYLDAFETLTRLRGSRILAAKELVYSHYQLQFEQDQGISRPRQSRSTSQESRASGRDIGTHGRIGFWRKLVELFTVRRNRNALITAVICMCSQQLCGVNVLMFYSSTIYSNAVGAICREVTPESLRAPLFMSWGIGLTNFIFSFPAYWLIDKKGRRWLLTTTIPFLCIFMTAAALSYVNSPHYALVGVFTYLYMVFYSWGLGPVPFTVSAEVFPLDHRVVGMSVAVCVNFFGAGLLNLVVPAISSSSLGHGGLLGIFAFLNIVALILITYFVRETVSAVATDNPNSMEPLALEELYKIFDLKTVDVLRSQTVRGVPWTVVRFARWCYPFAKNEQGSDRPEPLWYLWEQLNERQIELMEDVQPSAMSDDTTGIERIDRRPTQND